ncbi:hypothetical protein CEXT_416421 [Caerostris extrusa]|uniref:Uncharacterized protein n=1 Tax=Caerostris extrusa TaxID=172846 RepID=A0AAV4Y7H3_CAEEX|nr:hypothetical protein CEXT_416421 [Caerostris extrusa]
MTDVNVLHSKRVTIASETLNLPSPSLDAKGTCIHNVKRMDLITRLESPLRLSSLPSSFYCDAQRVENGAGLQWPKFSKSFPNNFAGGMLISPSEKFHGVVETVSGKKRWKENSCSLVFFSGTASPEPKICKCRRSSMKGDVRMSHLTSPQLWLKECQSGRGAIVAKSVVLASFLKFHYTMGLFGIGPTHWGFSLSAICYLRRQSGAKIFVQNILKLIEGRPNDYLVDLLPLGALNLTRQKPSITHELLSF